MRGKVSGDVGLHRLNIDGNFYAFEDAVKEYRKMARRVNQRIRRAEKQGLASSMAGVRGLEGYLRLVYNIPKEKKARVPENPKGSSDFEKLQNMSRDILHLQNFLNAKSTSIKYMKQFVSEKDKYFLEQYGIKTDSDLWDVLNYAKDIRNADKMISSDRIIFMYKEYKQKGYSKEMLMADIRKYKEGVIESLTDIEDLRDVDFTTQSRKGGKRGFKERL